ncbi:MAG: DUF1963 domain-containing protein [Pseudomonadota bacterium]
MDEATCAAFLRAIEATARPSVLLSREATAPMADWAGRLGGPAWRPAGVAWPTGGDGAPMLHLVSLDFAALPPLDGFPDAGLLQFFVEEDLLGTMWEPTSPRRHRLDYWPAPRPGGIHPQPDLRESWRRPRQHTFWTEEIGAEGRALIARAGTVGYGVFDYRKATVYRALLGPWPGAEDAAAHDDYLVKVLTLDEHAVAEGALTEHPGFFLGGQAQFCQGDPRGNDTTGEGYAEAARYDTTLLSLGPIDKVLNIGDGGIGTLMIPSTALARRAFDDTWWYWDCA